MQNQIQINKEILDRFALLIKNKKLAHAYLFIGPKDMGKLQTALAVAKFVNCSGEHKEPESFFCDSCSSCQKIGSGNHPDVTIYSVEEGDSIKIIKIRELMKQSQLRPFEAFKKVFIIQDADCLTAEGSNALLKTLEEPSVNSMLILTTSVPEKILDTVRSRCHAVHFFSLSREAMMSRLTSEGKASPEAAQFLSYFTEGCFGQAQRLYDQEFFEEKNNVIDNFVYYRENDAYIKKLLADKNKTGEALQILLFWFRDLLLLKTGVGEAHVVHLDRFSDLSQLELKYSFEQVNDIIEQIIDAIKMLGANLNVKIPLILLKEKIWLN